MIMEENKTMVSVLSSISDLARDNVAELARFATGTGVLVSKYFMVVNPWCYTVFIGANVLGHAFSSSASKYKEDAHRYAFQGLTSTVLMGGALYSGVGFIGMGMAFIAYELLFNQIDHELNIFKKASDRMANVVKLDKSLQEICFSDIADRLLKSVVEGVLGGASGYALGCIIKSVLSPAWTNTIIGIMKDNFVNVNLNGSVNVSGLGFQAGLLVGLGYNSQKDAPQFSYTYNEVYRGSPSSGPSSGYGVPPFS